MHLVIHQVVELEHIHITHGNRAIECFAGTPVKQGHLAAFRQVCQRQQVFHLGLRSTVEYLRGHRHTAAQIACHLDDFLIGERLQVFLAAAIAVIDSLQELTQLGDFALLFEHHINLLAQTFGSEAKVGFENLTHVHPRGHAQRVEHDIHRLALLVIGHIFHRHDDRDNTLVTVAARHFVAGLNAAFDGEIHLNDFQHARCQIVAALQLAFFVVKARFQLRALLGQLRFGIVELGVDGIIGETQLEPLIAL